MSGNVNAIVVDYLRADAGLTAIVAARIYSPRLPEKATLPAIGLFVRGGTSTPYIPPYVNPSFQFDCWGSTPLEARGLYTELYDTLQGIENKAVVVGGVTYTLVSAIEEVQGQDIQEMEYPDRHRVMTFFRVTIKI